ncbi:MAG: carboxypeptidase-like regulatory domain-containing protein, partial [Armatimonadota bacterium]|nr:carboxypeptidase-like regulatory domain-containing protein [Armatimonadota bacterium]
VQAGPDGVYRLTAPGPGQYFWQVQAPGRSAVEQSIQVPAGGLTLDTPMLKVRDLDIHLLKPDGTPMTTEWVRDWVSYRWPNNGSSNGSGLRRFPDAGYLTMDAPQNLDKLQEFVFGVQVPGVGCGQWRFTHWPEGSVTLQLSKGSTLVGEVVDDAGKPVVNATVTLTPNLPHVSLYTLDAGGRFEGAWAGNYNEVMFCIGDIDGVTNIEGKFSIGQLMYGEYEARVQIPGVGLRYHFVSLRGPDASILLSPEDRTTPKATYRGP